MKQIFGFLVLFLLLFLCNLYAADRPQWGEQYSRNMVSQETNLPDQFDPLTGKNIKWKAKLGKQTYSTPVVSGGKIFIGTNNEYPRDPRHTGDKSILLCLDEKDGSLLWQLVVPKLPYDIYWDWPGGGISSPATVEGDKVYLVSSRGEVLCMDIHGQANGNDGPYKDEASFVVPKGTAPIPPGPKDADILWMYDMVHEQNIRQHDAAHSSILIKGDYLYINTSNGVDNTHAVIRSPQAPSLIVLDKRTGKLAARDNEGIGPRIFHSTWSSPALGNINGQNQLFFGGGDGLLYAFKEIAASSSTPATLEKIWWYDGDPTAPKDSVHKYLKNRNISPSNIKSMPVFYNNKIYLTLGGDIWWGKNQSWIHCIDATGQGDVTTSAQRWSVELGKHCCSTPSIYNGLVFVADCSRYVYCLDAETGKLHWKHKTDGDMWGSTLVADNKVYIGNRRGSVWVFAADKNKKVIHTAEFDSDINPSPVAANGTLYIATMEYLYAIAE